MSVLRLMYRPHGPYTYYIGTYRQIVQLAVTSGVKTRRMRLQHRRVQMRRGLFAALHWVLLLLRLRLSGAITLVVAVGVVAVAPDPAAG